MRLFDSFKIVQYIFSFHEEQFRPLLQDKLLQELHNKYSEAMHEALRAIDNHAALPYKWFCDETLSQKVQALEEAYDATNKPARPMGKNSEKYPDLVPVLQPPPEETKKEIKPRQKRKRKEPKNATKKKTEKECKRPKLTESLPPPPAPSEPLPSYLPESVNVSEPVIEVLATGGPPPSPVQQQDPLESRPPIQGREEENGIREMDQESAMALDIERQLQEFYDQMCTGMKKLTIHDEH